MAVLEVNQMWSKDAFNVATLEGLRKKADIVTGYQIIVEPGTTEVEIAAHGDLPATGSLFVDGNAVELSAIRLKKRSFSKVSPIFRVATCNYTGEFGPTGATDSPINAPPVISWSDTETDEGIDEDWNGSPIVTANGEAINGVTMKIADNVLTVQKNYSLFSPWLTSQYRHSVNADTFAGYPPGTGRMTRFTAKQEWDEDDNGYWAVSASIQFRYPYNTTSEKAWYARVRHEGFYEKVGSKIIHAVDENKDKVSRPVLLKSDGTRETDPDNAYWLEFQRYGTMNYNALGLLN